MDLFGPPKMIELNGEINEKTTYIDVNIKPFTRYHVGFIPDKLPMVTKLNIKLEKNGFVQPLLDVSLTKDDINGGDISFFHEIW